MERIEIVGRGYHSQHEIDQLVEEKIKKVLPELLNKTIRGVEMRLKIEGCWCGQQGRKPLRRSQSVAK